MMAAPPSRFRGATALLAGLLVLPGAHAVRGPEAPFADLDAAVAAGVARGVYPGAVVVVGTRTSILHARGFGRLSWASRASQPVPDSTLYDLASLTKVVATASAALILVDRGRLDLDAPVHRYLRRFDRTTQRPITVRMLLDHTSGLRPYGDFFKRSSTPAGIASLVLREEPVRNPGRSAVYSDINAMLLGMVIEAITGESLARFVDREVLAPLGMRETGFNPPPPRQRRAAPTYADGRVTIAGVVHDRNARDQGGVSGHAGLFATASDLARFAQWWLRDGVVAESSLVSAGSMARFLERREASGTRLLGWDSPDPGIEGGSVFGTLLSPSAYGHTGWTGTQLWIDPDKGLFVVLLTNRSLNPQVGRSLRDLRLVRAQVADAAVVGASYSCQSPQSAC